ncbi:MAG: helix-turn-helix domain-containing protein [Bacilli bacterium]
MKKIQIYTKKFNYFSNKIKIMRINPFKLYHGAFIPNWLLCKSVTEVSQSAKLCYARLMQYAGKNGYAFPSLITLGKEIGLSKRQMVDIVKELEILNLIEVEKYFGKSSKYYFIKHKWMTGVDFHTGVEEGTGVGKGSNNIETGAVNCTTTGVVDRTLIESIEDNQKNLKESSMNFFKEFKSIYPKRAGTQGWVDAEKQWQARIKEGIAAKEMIDGAVRYKNFCLETGKINTEGIMMAQRFVGKAKHFNESWELPIKNQEVKNEPISRNKPKSAATRIADDFEATYAEAKRRGLV